MCYNLNKRSFKLTAYVDVDSFDAMSSVGDQVVGGDVIPGSVVEML